MTRRFSPFKFTRADAVVLIFVCLSFTAIVQLALSNSREQANRITCQNNLSEIGRAMQIYANDNDGEYPRAGGPTSIWTDRIADYTAPNRYLAFQMGSDGSGGYVTLSSSLYLLIKYAGLLPDSFICPGDCGATVYNPVDDGLFNITLTDLWDFGPHHGTQNNTNNHYSYAYHLPYGLYNLTQSSDPKMAVAADKNPWLTYTDTEAHFSRFDPDGDREAVKAGNALAHLDEGQNVLFVDGHVSFQTESFCGVNDDNIYTLQDGGDIRIGNAPIPFNSSATGSSDSLLVNEPGDYKKFVIKQSSDVNSSDLKQTSIIPTLDYTLPKKQNVIWCSAFQIAWDKLKNDVIGEPIDVIGAEDMTMYLNRAVTSLDDIEEESYYVNAGITGEGIIEQIQTDMNQFFPFEPAPFGGNEYNTEPNSLLVYSYLNLDIECEYPFYRNTKPFAFEDSNGTITDVTSFCNFSEFEFPNAVNIYKQVEILFGRFDSTGTSAEFAIDLCKYTQPYQVILAVVPQQTSARRSTIQLTISYVESKISEFKLNPDYNRLREFLLWDKLIVPDVLYKITHCFFELEDKVVGNKPWQDQNYYITEAMQVINFSLSRINVFTESVDSIDNNSLPRQRNFYFNRPFLIYVKKRGDEYNPFFVMWVDNPEMLNEFK